jgi:transcription elongation factor GreB
VVYADPQGQETQVTILGVDEADTAQGQISWVSPVARALLKAREGDVVKLALPDGVRELEVLSVAYPGSGEAQR